MKSEDMKGQAVSQEAKAVATGDMTTGSPMRNIVKFGVSGFFRLVTPYVRNKVLPACT